MGAEVSTGRSLGQSLLTTALWQAQADAWQRSRGPQETGGGGILEKSHRKGKLEAPRSMPQVFRGGKSRRHSSAEALTDAELGESLVDRGESV